jgi:hypothetical protein
LLIHFAKAHKYNFRSAKQVPRCGRDYCIELAPAIKKDKAGVKDIPKPVKSRMHKITFGEDADFDEMCDKTIEELKSYAKGWPPTRKTDIVKEVAKEKGIPLDEREPAKAKNEDFMGLPKMKMVDDICLFRSAAQQAYHIARFGWQDQAIMPSNFNDLWDITYELGEIANKDNFHNIMEFAEHLMADEALMLIRKCFAKNSNLAMHPAYVKCAQKMIKNNRDFVYKWLNLDPPLHERT